MMKLSDRKQVEELLYLRKETRESLTRLEEHPLGVFPFLIFPGGSHKLSFINKDPFPVGSAVHVLVSTELKKQLVELEDKLRALGVELDDN